MEEELRAHIVQRAEDLYASAALRAPLCNLSQRQTFTFNVWASLTRNLIGPALE
jgi:hypothetical protein